MADTASNISTASTAISKAPKFCIICAEAASEDVVKDKSFVEMMDLYWKGVRVDVKPELNRGLDLCESCFDSVLQFYQINDVLVYFESQLKELQRGILATNLKGVLKWQEKGLKLNKFQSDIMREWGTKLEPCGESAIANKAILDSYNVSLTHETETPAEGSGSSKATKPNSDDNSGMKSPADKRSPNKQKEPKKKRLRRGRTGDTSGEESDGSNFSDEVSVHLTSDDESTNRERSTRRAISEVSTTVGNMEKECPICLDKFESFSTLQKHLRQHKVAEGGYECFNCRQHFSRQPKLIEHKKTCKNNDS